MLAWLLMIGVAIIVVCVMNGSAQAELVAGIVGGLGMIAMLLLLAGRKDPSDG